MTTAEITRDDPSKTEACLCAQRVWLYVLLAVLSASNVRAQTSLATIVYPPNGATSVPTAGNVFSWNTVSDGQAYYVYIGSSLGQKDVFNSGVLTGNSVKIPTFLSNSIYYVRLWTEINGHWNNYYVDTTFSTSPSPATLTYPANGAMNIDPWATFAWAVSTNGMYSVSQASFTVWVGSSPGTSDVFNSGPVAKTHLFVPGLQGFTTYYVRLWIQTPQGIAYSDSSFTTGRLIAHLITPADGSVNVDPFANFMWNSIPNAQQYVLKVGTAPGAADVFNSYSLPATVTSIPVFGMLGGQVYYVQLSTELSGALYTVNSSFLTAVQPALDPATLHSMVQSATQAVRMMTVGTSNTPMPGTLLGQVVAADGRTVAFCTEYAKTLVILLMGERIGVRIRVSVLDGAQTHEMTEYYDTSQSKWVVADPTFGIVFFNITTGQYFGMDEMSAAVAGQNWSGIPYTLVTTYGTQVLNNYSLDPILLYLNPLPTADQIVHLPLPNSSLPYLIPHTAADIGQAAWYVFGFASPTDSATISDPKKGTIVLAAKNGSVWADIAYLHTGWTITSAPTGTAFYTVHRYLF